MLAFSECRISDVFLIAQQTFFPYIGPHIIIVLGDMRCYTIALDFEASLRPDSD